MFDKLRECIVVIAGLVPCYELGPSDNYFFTFIEKRTFEIAVGAEYIELLLGPTCRSPDQAIVFYSILALVERRDFDHCQRTGPGVELASEAVLLEYGLERKEEFHNFR